MIVVTIFGPTEEITLRRVIEIYCRLYIVYLIDILSHSRVYGYYFIHRFEYILARILLWTNVVISYSQVNGISLKVGGIILSDWSKTKA